MCNKLKPGFVSLYGIIVKFCKPTQPSFPPTISLFHNSKNFHENKSSPLLEAQATFEGEGFLCDKFFTVCMNVNANYFSRKIAMESYTTAILIKLCE